MPLDPKWSENNPDSPFRDNTDGAITAATLRQFASEVASDTAADDWAEYTPPGGTADLTSYTWTTPSASETLWLPAAGSGQTTQHFSYGASPAGAAYLTYTAGLGALLTVTLSGDITVTGVTPGTEISTVFFAGDPATASPTGIAFSAAPLEVETSPDTFSFSAGGTLRIPAVEASVMAGLRFTPPEGSPIEDSTIEVSVGGLTLTVIARPTASASPIVI